MGIGSSTNQYINSDHSQFISSYELNQILNGKRSKNIYQSQISQNNFDQQNSQYNSNHFGSQSYGMGHVQQGQSQYIRKVLSFAESSDSVTNYLALLQQVGRNIECENLYLPIMCNVSGQESTCTDYRRLQMYYQNYDVKITDQIAARKRQRESFSQEEVWYILYSILNACRMYQKISMSSGNLKTEKVLLNSKGHIKVINRLSYPQQQPSNFLPISERSQARNRNRSSSKPMNCMTSQSENYPRQFILNNSYESQYKSRKDHNTSFLSNYGRQEVKGFYAPEELRIMKQHIEKVINPNIAQTYSIGIIILEVCTFINGERFYDIDKLAINEHMMRRAQQMLANQYSKLLYNLVRTMLSNAYDRPLPSQIYSAFKPYEKSILALKPFKFDPKVLNQSLPMSQVSYY